MPKWVEGYGYSHRDIRITEFSVCNATIRYVVPIGIKCSRLQIILSNLYGTEDLIIDKATVGRVISKDLIDKRTLQQVTCSKSDIIIIPNGEEIRCDIMDIPISAGEEIGISLYIKNCHQIKSGGSTVGRRYVSTAGDYTELEQVPSYNSFNYNPEELLQPTVDIIKSVNVLSYDSSYCIAAFGDSITSMDYWRKALAARLMKKYEGHVSLLNYGIAGNRLLHPTGMRGLKGAFGEAGKLRIYRDGFEIKGIKYIILLEGTNDLIQPGINAPVSQSVKAGQIIETYEDIIKRAKEHGIKVIGATIPPFEGMGPGYSKLAENSRQIINKWIRKAGSFYAFIDFDEMLSDKDCKSRISKDLHIGDWLHPNETAGKLIADKVDLRIFEFK